MLYDPRIEVNSEGVEMEVNAALLYLITLTLPWGCFTASGLCCLCIYCKECFHFDMCMCVPPLLFFKGPQLYFKRDCSCFMPSSWSMTFASYHFAQDSEIHIAGVD